ncbi:MULTISPECIES: ferrous iron transport protein B [Mesotoga]|uniref:ferrous iron transport protein B n=1 Tax=Mesotoga TaxID=1184396 RepID=UPI0025969814|nr:MULTISPECIES: ferrous iron transport protein B [Mesotoga]HOP38579.1 ferrous iron transport protein B [Mesotoga prima]HPJ33106.1 ferrous iron transport protein B [Mesotoga prima]HRX66353.1 ferrous iron transport protein B [Mesotoga sp.]
MPSKGVLVEEDVIDIALAGNPNVGKTAVFNALTGMHQKIGNWPGVTIEKKEGVFSFGGIKARVVDLPGIYGLNAFSIDERISRDYLVTSRPDLVLSIIDSTNLQRNLYLTLELIEMGMNVIVVLNMQDELEAQGISIDTEGVARELGVPVVMISALKRTGIKDLKDKIFEYVGKVSSRTERKFHDQRIEEAIRKIESLVLHSDISSELDPRWLSIKLIEKDPEYRTLLERASSGIKGAVDQIVSDLEKSVGDASIAMAQERYRSIQEIYTNFVKKNTGRVDFTDKLDRILTNRWLGIPIFFFLMWLTFEVTFTIGNFFLEQIEIGFEWLSESAVSLLAGNVPEIVVSLVSDGIISGVGSVMVFVPNIFFLFLMIGVLESSGYMSRAAFVMDRLMHKIGLHGKSFIPMIIGFGCTVPAIMATRTLESRKDRLITMLVSPFMSCSARLPIYLTFTGIFFSKHQSTVVFSIYVIGIAAAIGMAMLFKSTILKGESSPFVLELPPYRPPMVKETLRFAGSKSLMFLKRAGTIIFIVVLVIWALATFPAGVEYGSKESYAGVIGSTVAPLMKPMGIDHWESGVAVLMGALAKEVVVGTYQTLVGEGNLELTLSEYFTPLSAYAFMLFTLLYMPCVAVFGAIWEEAGVKWALFTAVYTTVFAFIVASLVFQIGSLFLT